MKTCWGCGHKFDEENYYSMCSDDYDLPLLDMSDDGAKKLSRSLDSVMNHKWAEEEWQAVTDSAVGKLLRAEMLSRMDMPELANEFYHLGNRIGWNIMQTVWQMIGKK